MIAASSISLKIFAILTCGYVFVHGALNRLLAISKTVKYGLKGVMSRSHEFRMWQTGKKGGKSGGS